MTTKVQQTLIFFMLIWGYVLVYPTYSRSDEPDWYNKTPDDIGYYYGVGFSTESIGEAVSDAHANLILGIQVTIHAEVEHAHESTDDGKHEKVKSEFKTRNRSYAKLESLPGVEIVERKTDPDQGKHYVLARLSEEKFHQYLKKKQGDLKRHIEHGDKRLQERDVIAFLKAYREALKIAQTLKFLYDEVANVRGSHSDIDIQQKITSVQNDIQILKLSGDEQTCNYGSSLPESLVVRVDYQDKPLKEFPLKAIYTRGIGRLRNETGETQTFAFIYTDAEGKGRCRVDVVKSISRENYIQIMADAEAIKLPASKAVVFRYTSMFPARHKIGTPIITLNGSADEQTIAEGSKVDIEIRVPNKCHIHLFLIVANGDFRYLQSVPIERTYDGSEWRIISTNSGWALQMHQVPLTADYGLGIETLLVITTENAWKPETEQFATDSLIRHLDDSIGEEGWRVGWVSYDIVSKPTAVLTE